uniref:Uncharacterized protein n=1 Tax=viral metagenome TaxID=1070528 RepID=A0A6M3J3C3_9ZZZZ
MITPRTPSTRQVECAICAARDLNDCLTPTATAVEIAYDPHRDGLRERPVYACPDCAAQMED